MKDENKKRPPEEPAVLKYVFLIPITFFVSVPIIFIFSFFGDNDYLSNVKMYLNDIFLFWDHVIKDV